MGGNSVGQIGLDLTVNKKEFEQQMKGIQSLAKKVGATLAAAFAVKKLVDFSKSCISLASDLAEVQNVVDVVFPGMSKRIDDFAKGAIKNFGMSETMAKRFTGTFGAMAKAFGFSEQASYDMATSLTGLAADVASFYNINHEEAYTKLKSVFSGETETLKDLGIVMTQSALDAYAMANGYGKTTKAMTEQEKVALRYKFVFDQLQSAQGDFLRTSDSWANQTRQLSEQFNSLKASIGAGFIAALTPVVKAINAVIGRLLTLANAAKAVFGLFGGGGAGKGVAKAQKAQAAVLEDVKAGADGAGKALGGAGGAAKKAAKDIKGAATGIDELNIIQKPEDDSGGGSGGGGSDGGFGAEEFDFGAIESGEEKVDGLSEKMQAVVERAQALRNLFSEGFKIGFGDMGVLDSIRSSIASIRGSFLGLATDPEIQSGFNNLLNTVTYNFGQIAGSVASVGATIADNLLGGLALYLEGNAGRIKNHILEMFSINAEISTIVGNFSTAFAEVFSVFRSDQAKQITADVIKIFADIGMGVARLSAKLGRDVLDMLTRPFIDNKDKIKTALSGLIKVFESVTKTLSSNVEKIVDKVNKFYDEHLKPFLDKLSKGFSEVTGPIVDAFNKHIVPALFVVATHFDRFMREHLQPLIDKFLEFGGKVLEVVFQIWDKALKPFILWFAANVVPHIGTALKAVGDIFFSLFGVITDVLGKIFDALGGLMDFLVGVFTGDWKKAWDGIKTFFISIWDALVSFVTGILDVLGKLFSGLFDWFRDRWQELWNFSYQLGEKIWNAISSLAGKVFGGIRDTLANIWDAIKSKIETVWEGITSWIQKAWQGIKDFFKVDEMVRIGKNVIEGLLNGFKAMWENVSKWISEKVDFVKNAFSNLMDGVKGSADSASGPGGKGSSSSSTARAVRSGGRVKAHAVGGFPGSGELFIANENGVPEMIGRWGGKSAVANNMQITQGIALAVNAGMRHALSPLAGAITRLAETSTPPLTAVSTRGRDGGMQDLADRAMLLASSHNLSGESSGAVLDLLRRIATLIESMDLTVNIDLREVKQRLADLDRRSGYNLRTT